MTSFAARVEVSHRPGIADPAGATVERALPALGYSNVTQVHIAKVITLVVEAENADTARTEVEEMCERLLANPVIESYEVSVSTSESTP
jgi:phosphoribosylformylglycinamidine synthase PurS subunit